MNGYKVTKRPLPAPAVVRHQDVVVDHVLHRLDGGGDWTRSLVVQKFQGDYTALPVDPDDALVVVGHRPDGAGHVTAVVVVVHGVTVVVIEIVP